MCGIIGLFLKQAIIKEEECLAINKALDRMAYRGPDGCAHWKNNHVLLGHRRLSIIDLSDAGTQPLVDSEKGLVITFNGEIYNYRELRDLLSSKGYSFHTKTDTEVILACYDYFGDTFVQHLRGMFAFCLYDFRKRLAFLVRDRAGKKPLYFYLDQDRLIFSSEIKYFHAFRSVPLDVDEESLKAFFVLQYIPGTHTIYRQVRRLGAGTILKINLQDWQTQETTYWSVFDRLQAPVQQVTEEQIDHILNESVRYRLISDVEVGLLLSGGVDSSLLAWYVQNNGGNLRAFTARFERDDLNELPYAELVARHFGLDLVVTEGSEITPDIFQEAIFHADEPLGDAACIPTFLLARDLSKYVTVILSGEGADELFYGYDHYQREISWQKLNWMRGKLPLLGKLASQWETQSSVHPAMTRLVKTFSDDYDLGVLRWTTVFALLSVRNLMPGANWQIGSRYLQEMQAALRQITKRTNPATASLTMDMLYWLPDDLLVKVDRMSMAHSVEARAPFLDQELIETALAIPYGQKINQQQTKTILRSLLRKKLPHPLIDTIANRKKHGFEPPVSEWLVGPLREVAEWNLSKTALAASGVLDPIYVQQLWKKFLEVGVNSSIRRKIWLMVCFQSWYQWHQSGFGLN